MSTQTTVTVQHSPAVIVSTQASKTRDQVRDLHGNYSRPRPRPWPFGLETKTETFEKWTLECTRVTRPWSRDHNTAYRYKWMDVYVAQETLLHLFLSKQNVPFVGCKSAATFKDICPYVQRHKCRWTYVHFYFVYFPRIHAETVCRPLGKMGWEIHFWLEAS